MSSTDLRAFELEVRPPLTGDLPRPVATRSDGPHVKAPAVVEAAASLRNGPTSRDVVVASSTTRFAEASIGRGAPPVGAGGSLRSSVRALGAARLLPSGEFILSVGAESLTVSAESLVNLRLRAGAAMRAAAVRIDGEVEAVVDGWRVVQAADEASPVVGLVSRVLGDVDAFEDDLREAAAFTKAALGRFRLALDRGDLDRAASELEAAEIALRGAQRAWGATREGLEGGARTAIESLEHTRNAAAVTVGLLAIVASGGAAAGALTTGAAGGAGSTAVLANGIATATPIAGALGETAERLRLELPIDWAATTKDAIAGVVMARIGGRVSQAAFKHLAGVPAVRAMGRAAFARVLGSVVAHEAATVLQTTADAVFEAARGRPITWQDYEDELLARLTDPKGIFIATVFGAVTARFAATSGQNLGPVRRVATGGARNERPLTPTEAEAAIAYAERLGIPRESIKVSENMNTGYKSVFGQDVLYVGTDVLPAARPTDANGRVSMKGALAHEITGHRSAEMAGKTQANLTLEEAQASIRAARFGPELSFAERFTLLRDAVTRLHREGLSVKDVREELWIDEP